VTASARIGVFVAEAAHLYLTEAERHLAFRALFDTVGVAVAGRREAAARLAHDYVASELGRGRALVWGEDATLPPELAAWVNGIAAHVLDFDDVMVPMRGHISVAIIPALLALSPEVDATGFQFARAYAMGFEVVARMSRAVASTQYGRGWHTTASLGVLGATVASAVLLRLDAVQTSNALGLAVAQASGSRQNFGTMAKSFQIGECARTAVRAVLLAGSGFNASPDALDGPMGYAALYGADGALSDALADLGKAPLSLVPVGLEVKKYPCCYATHLALDGILELRRAHRLSLDSVMGISILASHRALEALISGVPQSALAAKFSMAYTVAKALRDGTVRLSAFREPGWPDPDVVAFLPRISVSEAHGPSQPRWAEIRVDLVDGRQIIHRVDRLRGGAQDPLSDAELTDKVQDCFDFAQAGVSALAFAEAVFSAGERQIQDVIAGLSRRA